jgi:hypothetical protein
MAQFKGRRLPEGFLAALPSGYLRYGWERILEILCCGLM